MKKLVLLAVIVLGFAATSLAQASASASVYAKINAYGAGGGSGSSSTGVYYVQDMDFGTITNSATGGTVKLEPSGSITTVTGGVVPDAGSFTKEAIFEIRGANATVPTFTCSAADADLSLTGGAAGVKFRVTTPADPGDYIITHTGTTDGACTHTIKIGGTLTIPAGATFGAYSANNGLIVTFVHL